MCIVIELGRDPQHLASAQFRQLGEYSRQSFAHGKSHLP
jgi:hypothetical protein